MQYNVGSHRNNSSSIQNGGLLSYYTINSKLAKSEKCEDICHLLLKSGGNNGKVEMKLYVNYIVV